MWLSSEGRGTTPLCGRSGFELTVNPTLEAAGSTACSLAASGFALVGAGDVGTATDFQRLQEYSSGLRSESSGRFWFP